MRAPLALALALAASASSAVASPRPHPRPAPMPHVSLAHVGTIAVLWRWATREDTPDAWRVVAEKLDLAGRTSGDLALAAIAAWRNAVALEYTPPPAPDFRPQPRPFTAIDAGLLHAIDVALPIAPDRTELAYLRARLSFNHDLFDDAAAGFDAIVNTAPTHPLAGYAANMLLDSLNRLERYDDLLVHVARIRTDHALLAAQPDLAHMLELILEQGYRLSRRSAATRADQIIDAASYCADLNMRAFETAPPAFPGGAELLFEAAMCSYKSGARDEAESRWRQLLTDFPDSPFAVKARSMLGP